MAAETAIDRAHAVLSASGSGKWLVCTPSARLEDSLPDDSSADSEDGTKAHDLCEALGRAAFFGEPAVIGPDLYDAEMWEAARTFVAHCKELVDAVAATGEPYSVLLEQKLDYSRWAPEGFGTSDFTLVTKHKVWVRDFKYGKGVRVSAEGNTQMKLYGLGAYNDLAFAYEDIEALDIGIVQPRLDAFSSCEVSLADLLAWGDWVITRAELAWEGQGEFMPGLHCTEYFCRARFTCRARADMMTDAAFGDGEELKQAGPLLSTEEIAKLLPLLGPIASWAKALEDYALNQAVNAGVQYPGYKLVEGRSNRFISDTKLAGIRLVANGVLQEKLFPPVEPKMVGITELERLVGKKKFAELLGDLLVKPQGKPTLAPDDDPRTEWRPRNTADEDFGE